MPLVADQCRTVVQSEKEVLGYVVTCEKLLIEFNCISFESENQSGIQIGDLGKGVLG